MLIRNNNSEHSCSTYQVPGAVLNSLHMFISCIFYLCVSSNSLNSLSGLLGERKHCYVDQNFPMRQFHPTQEQRRYFGPENLYHAGCRGLSDAVGICLIHALASANPTPSL